MSVATEDPQVFIKQIASETLVIPIVGTMPLLVHNFSEKAKRQMLDAQQSKRTPKTSRDPQAEYEAAFYRTKDGYGFPAAGFKKATVGAARFYGKDVKMTDLRQSIFVHGELSDKDAQALVPIVGEPKFREDVVRINNGRSTDLRYRPEFVEWSCELRVTYVKTLLSQDSLISLIDAGGLGCGVGEWRPERGGSFGTYKVDPTRTVKVENEDGDA